MSQETPKAKPFADKEEIKFYFDKALPWLNSAQHAKMGEYLKDVLVENCEAEREFYNALDYFLREIKSAAEPIHVPADDIQKLSGKLFELRFLMKMVHAVGLGRYEEQIMELEIRKRWPVLGAAPAAPVKKSTERNKS